MAGGAGRVSYVLSLAETTHILYLSNITKHIIVGKMAGKIGDTKVRVYTLLKNEFGISCFKYQIKERLACKRVDVHNKRYNLTFDF